ncbi:MAG: hypothetical protein JWN44_5415 [Myxococcales bacterium]|nr:hypothetical protein [Myxococcales bacterium]
METSARRADRVAKRREREHQQSFQRQQREMERQYRDMAKAAAKQQSAAEAQQFDDYLRFVVSMHFEGDDPWEWYSIVNSAPPAAPHRSQSEELAARRERQSYKPRFLEKLFGSDKKRTAALDHAIATAKERDAGAYGAEYAEYQKNFALWESQRRIGAGVLANDPRAYRDAITHARPFDDVTELGSRVSVVACQADVAALACEITDEEIIPREEVKLTATGKLSSKVMAATKYWALYQDHVCSCALKIARETFGVLPIKRVIVNVGKTQINTATGHAEQVTYLGVHITRSSFSGINLAAIDPSDSMKNFQYRMKFKKTEGFMPVEPITVEEQWVTT